MVPSRWVWLQRDDRICAQCGSGEVEDAEHVLLRCDSVTRERMVLEKRMEEIVEWVSE